MLKTYNQLTKSGIVIFVILTGLAGYAVSYPLGNDLELWQPILLALGLYMVSSGSFALNQAQEVKTDAKMPRTAKRPIVTGKIDRWQAYVLGVVFVLFGLGALALISEMSVYVAVATIVLYNGFYTLWWKRAWAFGAVPGAIPGALPVTIGYAANDANIFSAESLYLFMIVFLWQMPHFWALAIRYREDYQKGEIPVLPAIIGVDKTLYHIGLYTIVYVGLALAAPLFVSTDVLYVLLIVPFAAKVLVEYFKYYRKHEGKAWLPFFLWVNLSVLIFIAAPVFDKWLFHMLAQI